MSDLMLNLQTITLLHRLGRLTGTKFKETTERLELVCRERFVYEKDRPYTDIASWAEAVRAFSFSDQNFAYEIADWLVTHQNLDGSFNQSRMNGFSYTRGSTKIFEV